MHFHVDFANLKIDLNNYDFTKITHILYAFANVNSDGTLKLSDPYADTQVSLMLIERVFKAQKDIDHS